MATISKAVATLGLAVSVMAYLLLGAQGCSVTIVNKCGYPVTACGSSGNDSTARYSLNPGQWQTMDFGSSCQWPAAVVFASVGGQCHDANEANLAQFNIGAQGGQDYYSLSNVVAYTIGMQIVPNNPSCRAPKCVISNIPAFCQPANQLHSFPTGAYSCHNIDGTVGRATPNNSKFANACPEAYSYDKDQRNGLSNSCPTGTNYDVIFCPSTSSA